MTSVVIRRIHRATTLVFTLAVLVAAEAATAQTGPLLRAPHVRSRVRIQWDPELRRIVAAVDEGAFHVLAGAPPFLTDGAVTVTYPRLNPLLVSATITPKDGAVPADLVIARLRGLLAFATVAMPSPGAGPVASTNGTGAGGCPALASARVDVAALASTLSVTRDSPTVATLVASWRQGIDDEFRSGRSGPDAVAATMARMDAFIASLDARLGDAERILSRIEAAMRVPAAQDCEASARLVYDAVSVSNPRGRLAQLAAVRGAVMRLHESVRSDYLADPMRWQGAEFRIDVPVRPAKQAAEVTVRVSRLDFDVDPVSGAMTAVEEHSGSENVVVRRFTRFEPDFAVATIIGSVTTPGYGTTRNAEGETVVSRLPSSGASVQPGFFASFVCRCQTGPLVAPMVQVGIATSSDHPALLVGGGLRLFGLPKGEAALGAGGMIALVKDLRSLRVGDPVGGTSDIQADRHYVRRGGYYLALQYKF